MTRKPQNEDCSNAGRQIPLLILACVLLGLMWQRHVTAPGEEDGRAIEYEPAVVIELAGEVPLPGVYFFSTEPTVAGVCKTAGVDIRHCEGADKAAAEVLSTGSCVVMRRREGTGFITVGLMAAEKRIALGIPLDLNGAGREELVKVPGIGTHTADAIISHRNAHGPFAAVEDLKNVRGIGEKKLEKFRKYLVADTREKEAVP